MDKVKENITDDQTLARLYGLPPKAKIVETAADFCKPKPIQEEDKNLHLVAVIAQILFPVISIFLGYHALKYFFTGKIENEIVLIGLSVAILWFLEFGKIVSLKQLVKRIKVLKNERFSDFSFVAVFSVTSIFLASTGMYVYVKDTDKTVSNFTQNHITKVDSTQMRFDQKINYLQAQIDTLNSYKTNRFKNLLTKDERALVLAYQSQIIYLENQKNLSVSELKTDYKPELQKVETSFNSSLLIDCIIAVILEILIVLINIYLASFLIAINDETKILNSKLGYNVVTTSVDNIANLLHAIEVNQFAQQYAVLPQRLDFSQIAAVNNQPQPQSQKIGFIKSKEETIIEPTNDDRINEHRVITGKRVCKQCGKEFFPQAPRQIYCGTPCHDAWHFEKKGTDVNKIKSSKSLKHKKTNNK